VPNGRAPGPSAARAGRAVLADRAGVPLAATTYYFASIRQLTEEALRLHVGERVSDLQGLAESAATGSRTADKVAERFVAALLARDRDATIAQFEVYLEAARNPALRQCAADALDAFESLARTALTALGARRPAEAAAAFVAVINGFALNGLARPRPPEADGAAPLATMRSLFISQIMDDDEAARWLVRLREPVTGLSPSSP